MVVLNKNSVDDNASNVPEYSVSEISGAIKRTLESGFSHIRVRGECGRITNAKSGHVYFDLKDNDALLSAVIWAGVARGLKTKPEEGLEVIVTGKITTFGNQSKYQLVVERIEPAGIGAILLQLEERKKRLSAEGLFDIANKQKIPFLPKTIGVVTSPTGAVIRDIIHRVSERFPTHIILWRVLVQGDKAAAQIANAIDGFNKIDNNGAIPKPDVLIVARGGGSIEDLWAFNEEIVVRAVANSKIPIISAVGHETDTTLIDYAADLRAPTPTGAAEYAVPVRLELIDNIAKLAARLSSGLLRRANNSRLEFMVAQSAFPKPETLLSSRQQRIDNVEFRFMPSIKRILENINSRINNIAIKLRPNILHHDLKIKNQALLNISKRNSMAFQNLIKSNNQNHKQNCQRLENSFSRFENALKVCIKNKQDNLNYSAQLLSAVDFNKVLERGFAIIKSPSGKIISDISSANKENEMAIMFKDGLINVRKVPQIAKQGNLF